MCQVPGSPQKTGGLSLFGERVSLVRGSLVYGPETHSKEDKWKVKQLHTRRGNLIETNAGGSWKQCNRQGLPLGPAYIVASLFSPASRLQFSLIPCPCLQSDTQEGGREGDWLHWGHVSALVQLAKAGEQGHRLLWALGKLEF